MIFNNIPSCGKYVRPRSKEGMDNQLKAIQRYYEKKRLLDKLRKSEGEVMESEVICTYKILDSQDKEVYTAVYVPFNGIVGVGETKAAATEDLKCHFSHLMHFLRDTDYRISIERIR